MLREVHHRLKNNLLMVASYVTLQIDDHASDRERQVLQAIRSNLESIALVHERLYREDSLSSISFGDYLQDVVHAAVDVFGRSIAAHVALDSGECPMEMNRALRLGLVVNEVVMNSLQHAFPDQTGSIRVTLDRTPSRRARIRIQDDGVGVSDRHVDGEAGFGIQIIRAMVDQLGGEVSFNGDEGTTVTIIFDCEGSGA
jgi:two-component sensor histidine kinase